MGPREAGKVFKRLWPDVYYGQRRFPFRYKYELGDKVRISLKRNPLKHSFSGTFSEEIFVIIDRHPRDPVVYRLADSENYPVRGLFTEAELSKVKQR